MKQKIQVTFDEKQIIFELDDSEAPKTVESFLNSLPFEASFNVWGQEIYTSEFPMSVKEENAKSPVQLNDVAFWPTGKAICLFFGKTPIENGDEIMPASPVNVFGKIINPDKSVLKHADGKTALFSKL